MVKIQFSNGQTVEFSGTPTQQDVEQVATKLGINKKPTSFASETAKLKNESDRLNSPLGIAKETASETAKSLVGGAITFAKSAVNAPVDIVRGLLGKAPLTDNSGLDSIQAQATQKTADVFDQKKSPIRATSELVGQTVADAGDILGVEGLIKGGAKLAEKGITKLATERALKTEAKASAKITEMIAPNATKAETKLALKEGRFVEGKERTIFRSGTEDKILPSQKTLNATETIINKIPNASKMKPAELYKAVDNTITKTAENLRPAMKATPIKPETIQKINTDWEALKKAQIQVADATEEANVIKLQKQFEERLMKAGNQNHDDLWQARIDYDNSIPSNVKRANSISSESLQNKKEIWLQNRKILNDAFESSSKPEFKEMANLYEAKNSLLSTAKVSKAQVSKIVELYKKHPEIASLLKGAGLYGILKSAGVPLP